ncbi:MAG: hypothetical protein IJX52_04235 [Oscillibacter sp.]|nr:hypothetical protein [Oscillibacter sp.]
MNTIKLEGAALAAPFHIADAPFHKLQRKGGMAMEIVFVPGGKDREELAAELIKSILGGKDSA